MSSSKGEIIQAPQRHSEETGKTLKIIPQESASCGPKDEWELGARSRRVFQRGRSACRGLLGSAWQLCRDRR